MARESRPQAARRYRAAIRFIADRPDAEELWPIARTALSMVLEGSTIEAAWRAACIEQGYPDPDASREERPDA